VPVADVVTAITDWKTRIDTIGLYRDYDEGRHRWGQFATAAFLKKYQWVLENSRENLCPVAISAFCDKLSITGWDGPGATQAAQLADDLNLRRIANLVHTESYRSGDGYVLVWPMADGTRKPIFHRSQNVVPWPSQDDPDTLDWVAKIWLDKTGYGRCNIYYPDRAERYATAAQLRPTSTVTVAKDTWPVQETSWLPFDGDGEPDTVSHDFDRVPWEWFPRAAPDQGAHGVSILRDVIPLQDALNKSVADMIVADESFAAPLRALMNYQPEVTIDPKTGKATEKALSYDETRNRIFGVKGPGPLTQLDPPDASKLIVVQDAWALKIARVIGIPAYYMAQSSGDVPSGESLRVLTSRLTAGVANSQEDFTDPWSGVLDLLGVPDATPQWAPAAPLDEAEQMTMAKTKHDIGYPLSEIARDLGEDPDSVQRILDGRDAEDAQALTAGDVAVQRFRDGQDPAQALR